MPFKIETWKAQAQALGHELYALALAYRDPRTPWYARLWAALILAYALSPVDLVPDFIPVLGYLDDVLLLPLGIKLALRLISPAVLEDARKNASEHGLQRPGLSSIFPGCAILVLVVMAIILITRMYLKGN